MLFIGIKSLKIYGKYTYGKYLFASMFFYSIWLILYVLVFTTIKDKDILLIISRILYGLSLLGMYFMILFILLFNNKIKFLSKKNLLIIFIFSTFFLLSIFTKFIISDMLYSEELGFHYEVFGAGYLLYAILYIISPILFLIVSYIKIKNTKILINKIRLKYISVGYLIFIFLYIFFLAILPLFNIWILQKEQILFFIPFILSIWYSITRYHFIDMKIGLGKILIYLLSFLGSIFFVNILKIYYLNLSNSITSSWGLSSQFGTTDLIIGIILFLLFHHFLNKIFLGNTKILQFSKKIDSMKHSLPFLTTLNSLNNYLGKEFKHLFNIKFVSIYLFENEDKSEIKNYFNKNNLNEIFINDIVFIEENKNKFNYNKFENEIKHNHYIIFPLFNNENELIGLFNLGAKPFKDHYYSEEIEILKNFSYFLEGHIKYIGTYLKLEEINLNLDKRIDEKTIEYNNLINKQKEFISVVSHEIKGPIASSIFQGDCILDDVKDGKYDEKYLKKEIGILNEQLLKSGRLIDKLFDVQLYDVKGIKLYMEKINLSYLIIKEVEIYKKVNKDIKFNLNIDKGVGFLSIDKIQFTQVINNLLTNAVKFSKENNKNININCFLKGKYIFIEIEDSGKGFDDINIKNIFDQYSTGNISGTGLGLGLFLCKRIVELHNGIISASVSKKIGGAKFTIRLNKELV